MHTILTNFQMIKPPHEKKQAVLNKWLTDCHLRAEQARTGSAERISSLFSRYTVKESQISKRSFECADILEDEVWQTNKIYRVTSDTPSGVSISERNQFFAERALSVMHDFYSFDSKIPDHLIHVTCTGYVAPNAAQLVVAEKKWSTQITNAYHMGCYAALPAIRIANALVKSSEAENYKVDVIHNEMCGLHLNPPDHSPEQIVVQSLFADGHIKYSILSENQKPACGLRLLAIREMLIPESANDMSWQPNAWGMKMTLSREVPSKIQRCLLPFLQTLWPERTADLLKSARFAIHPGGPKIIESVQTTLEIRDDQCAESKKILFERGNMSSATLPHIWQEILAGSQPSGQKVVSLAFGPGLTLFGAVFEVV